MSSHEEGKLQKRLNLDLLAMGQLIETQFKSVLKPPPLGVYRADSVEPALQPGQTYYVKSDNGELQAIQDFDKIKTAVYDKSGKMIIPSLFMKNKKKMLSGKPILPYRGILIAEQIITRCIDNFVMWRSTRYSRYDRIEKHFIDNVSDEIDFLEAVDAINFGGVSTLYDWLGVDSWNIYLCHRKNAMMVIEQHGDYRIEDWTRRFNEGEIKL